MLHCDRESEHEQQGAQGEQRIKPTGSSELNQLTVLIGAHAP